MSDEYEHLHYGGSLKKYQKRGMEMGAKKKHLCKSPPQWLRRELLLLTRCTPQLEQSGCEEKCP